MDALIELRTGNIYSSFEYQAINKAIEKIDSLPIVGQISDSRCLEDDMR